MVVECKLDSDLIQTFTFHFATFINLSRLTYFKTIGVDELVLTFIIIIIIIK